MIINFIPFWLLMMTIIPSNCDIISSSGDGYVKVGDSVTINCTTNKLPIIWSYSYDRLRTEPITGGNSGKLISDKYKDRIRLESYDIDRGIVAYNLIIINATLMQAGEYTCNDNGNRGRFVKMYLTVISGDPKCEFNTLPATSINDYSVTDAPIEISCSIEHNGTTNPILWYSECDEGYELTPLFYSNKVSKKIRIRWIGHIAKCTINSILSNNLPYYKYTKSYVWYKGVPVKNITFDKWEYRNKTVVMATVYSNPTATYVWTELILKDDKTDNDTYFINDTNTTIKKITYGPVYGPTLVIRDKKEYDRIFECTATNIITYNSSHKDTFIVKHNYTIYGISLLNETMNSTTIIDNVTADMDTEESTTTFVKLIETRIEEIIALTISIFLIVFIICIICCSAIICKIREGSKQRRSACKDIHLTDILPEP